MQQHLNFGCCLAASEAKPAQGRRNDLGIVEHQHIAGAELRRQIADRQIGKPRAHYQQLRGLTRNRRTKRNALRWQFEVKVGSQHGLTGLTSRPRQPAS